MDQSLGWRRSCSHEPPHAQPRILFVHACRPRSPSSSYSMHHERMAHILSPEVLPHPRSLLTRATFSRRFGVCSLSPPQGACLKSFTLCSECVCVWQWPSLECCVNHAELSGALFCSGPAWPAWPPSCCRRRCVFPSLAMRWGPEDLDQPDLPQRFPEGPHPSNHWLCKSPSPSVVFG